MLESIRRVDQGGAGATASLGRRLLVARSGLLASIVLALVAGLAGDVVGIARSGVSIHTGMGYSAIGAISLTGADDRWVYGVPLDVSWTDARGNWHERGRPECLPPTGVEVGPINFAATDVHVGGVRWRQVVWVSCSSGAAHLGG